MGTLLKGRVWDLQNKTIAIPTKTSPRLKQQSYEKLCIPQCPERNNAANEVKRKKEKKNLTVSHTQHRAPLIFTLISTIGKEWGHEKNKGASHQK